MTKYLVLFWLISSACNSSSLSPDANIDSTVSKDAPVDVIQRVSYIYGDAAFVLNENGLSVANVSGPAIGDCITFVSMTVECLVTHDSLIGFLEIVNPTSRTVSDLRELGPRFQCSDPAQFIVATLTENLLISESQLAQLGVQANDPFTHEKILVIRSAVVDTIKNCN